MSSSMVRKSLAIVDADFRTKEESKNKRKRNNIKNIIPENHKIIKKINRKGKTSKSEVLQTTTKTSVEEARKTCKTKEAQLKENINKLALLREACSINLDDEFTEQIVARAVTRRPVLRKSKSKKEGKTAFTEEDFAKFEAEFFDK